LGGIVGTGEMSMESGGSLMFFESKGLPSVKRATWGQDSHEFGSLRDLP
jgi:hypothetical protein